MPRKVSRKVIDYKTKLRQIATDNNLTISKYKNNTVWQYWEKKDGRDIPGYIAYCMERTRRQCAIDGLKYVLITPENLTKYIPANKIPNNYYLLEEIAHRADYVRVAALLYYGGFWVDSDCLIIDSLRPLFDDITKRRNDIVYFDISEKDDDVEVQIGLLGSKQFNSIYYKWYTRINTVLKKSVNFDWTAIGGDLLRKIINRDNKSKILCYDQDETTYPLHWTQASDFFKVGNSDYLRRDFQPAIMLYNHIFPKEFKNLDDKQFMKWLKTSKTVLADLMRKTE